VPDRPEDERYGTTVPSTAIQATSSHIGALTPSRGPRSGTVLPMSSNGNVHHGSSRDQKTAEG
jgi:hypothetical protein